MKNRHDYFRSHWIGIRGGPFNQQQYLYRIQGQIDSCESSNFGSLKKKWIFLSFSVFSLHLRVILTTEQSSSQFPWLDIWVLAYKSKLIKMPPEFFIYIFLSVSKARIRKCSPWLFIQAASAHHNFSDLIRIAIGRRSTVLQISTLMFSHISRNSNGSSTIGYTGREIMNRWSLMQTSQSSFIVFAWRR